MEAVFKAQRVGGVAVFGDQYQTPGSTIYTLTVEPASISVVGQSVSLSSTRKISAIPASVTFVGQNAGVYVSRNLTVSPGSLSFIGGVAGLTYVGSSGPTYTLNAIPLVISFVGQGTNLLSAKKLQATGVSVSFTGEPVALKRYYELSAQEAVFSLVPQAINLSSNRVIRVQPTALSLIGQSANLVYSGSTGSAVFPTPTQVLYGVVYGPTGVEYTGLLNPSVGTTVYVEQILSDVLDDTIEVLIQ